METNNFTFRQATKADETAIKALIKEVDINPLGIHWERFLLVVDVDDQLIGCGQIKPHKDGSRELASIAVRRGWRNQGIARAIIQNLMNRQGRPLWLTCRSKLTVFYEPFGFVEIKELTQMPTYFKRASRFFRLFKWLTRTEAELAVMVWR